MISTELGEIEDEDEEKTLSQLQLPNLKIWTRKLSGLGKQY